MTGKTKAGGSAATTATTAGGVGATSASLTATLAAETATTDAANAAMDAFQTHNTIEGIKQGALMSSLSMLANDAQMVFDTLKHMNANTVNDAKAPQ